MDPEEIEQWKAAGAIAAKGRRMGEDLVEEGVTYLEVAETIEQFIRDEGAKPAFPVNISANVDAAHDSALPGDERVFEAGDVIKLDIGAHLDGYIGDTAVTVIVGENETGQKLKDAAMEALENALGVVGAGVKLTEIGATIQKTIEGHGFHPVANLTGHSIERYSQHAGLSIPNVDTGSQGTIPADTVIAIEPFATNGVGRIHEARDGGIYHFQRKVPQRLPAARQVLQAIENGGHTELPFSTRWVQGNNPPPRLAMAIRTLERAGALHGYGVLREDGDGLVAQAEHTMIVLEDEVIVTTQ